MYRTDLLLVLYLNRIHTSGYSRLDWDCQLKSGGKLIRKQAIIVNESTSTPSHKSNLVTLKLIFFIDKK